MSRILIADDEEIEIKALEMMIHLDFPKEEVLSGAVNGVDLIAKIEQYHPDIVIADINMPGMSGLDALELTRKRYPDMKIIISTAYSDFDFAKRALKLGSSDYLLKPISRKSFSDTLGSVLARIKEEKEKISSEQGVREDLGKMNRIVGEEFLSSLLLGEPNEASFQMYVKSLPGGYYGAVPLTVRFAAEGNLADREVYRKLEEEIFKTLETYCNCVGKSFHHELYFLIFPNARISRERMKGWLLDISHMAMAGLDERYKDKVAFGFGPLCEKAGEIRSGLEQSRITAGDARKDTVGFYKEKARSSYADPLSEDFSRITPLLRQGRHDEALQKIREAFEKEDVRVLPLEDLKMFILEDLSQIGGGMGTAPFVRYMPHKTVSWETFASASDSNQVMEWLIHFLKQMAQKESNSKKTSEYISRALLYMEGHYAEDLSLDKVAAEAGISSFYMSRLFKQELQCSFVEALTQIRLEQSFRMIREGNMTIKEIALRAGYRNATYFYKVFKKYTGISVGDLRDFWDGRPQLEKTMK